jgi:hypothetical protein
LKCVYGDINKLTVPQIESQYRRILRRWKCFIDQLQ